MDLFQGKVLKQLARLGFPSGQIRLIDHFNRDPHQLLDYLAIEEIMDQIATNQF